MIKPTASIWIHQNFQRSNQDLRSSFWVLPEYEEAEIDNAPILFTLISAQKRTISAGNIATGMMIC
jgi:hypothetical protein